MKGLKDEICPIHRLSPNDGKHYFYGYYDNPPFLPDGESHLCHRVDFMNRLHTAEDVCTLGVLRGGQFEPFAETKAWNFQQGAMLQVLGGSSRVLYNCFEDGAYRACIHDLHSGSRRLLPMPAANVSRDGKWAISINFSRIFNFRPGYGYACMPDPWMHVNAPEDDGVFVINLETGECRLVLSYAQIAQLFAGTDPEMLHAKLVINHITFNPSASRFMFQVRNFPPKGKIHWTGVATADRDGQNLYQLMEFSPCSSHYAWRDDEHILMYVECHATQDVRSMALLTDRVPEVQVYDPARYNQDIHCYYSPDLSYFSGDGYPDEEGYRPAFLHAGDKEWLLFRAWSSTESLYDWRCDLHMRWRPDGKARSFDSTHEGFRGVYLADLTELMKGR